MIKRGEYADAGFPHYWIVDFDAPVALIACHLGAEFGYQDTGSVISRFVTIELFPVGLRLHGLLPDRAASLECQSPMARGGLTEVVPAQLLGRLRT
ncbi:MAG: hypothetical protein JO115_01660 [Pseudonocardiales bacterium]|nr:hypothetical protein [Pseudonocardiales bacterium]